MVEYGYDWKPDPANTVEDGIHRIEVKKVELTKSKTSGDDMLNVDLIVIGKTKTVRDRWMLMGKGKDITSRKLRVFGFAEGGKVDFDNLLGKRAFAALKFETREANGKTYSGVIVDIGAKGSEAGFWADGTPPIGYVEPKEDPEATPF